MLTRADPARRCRRGWLPVMLLGALLLCAGCGGRSPKARTPLPPPPPAVLVPGTGILSHEYEEREVLPRMVRVASLPHGAPGRPRRIVEAGAAAPEVTPDSAPATVSDTRASAFAAVRAAQEVNAAPAPEEWRTLAREAEEIFGLDAALVLAVIRAESSFNHEAQSPAGAQGAMQIMPGTQEELGLIDPFDPRANVYAGSEYLMHQLQRFGNVELALAAYNAGPESVERYGGIPPFAETQEFVRRVLAYWKCSLPADDKRTLPSASTPRS